MKRSQKRKAERGIALLTVLLFLLLLSGLAVGMMYMSSTETQINSNFRAEQTAYFAARTGLEEARDRMRASATSSLAASLPTAVPTSSGGVLYIINQGTDPVTIQPWSASNAYFDTELCHEGTALYSSVPTSDQPCTTAPTGSSWYTSTTTALPLFASTGATIPYKWARITLKNNNAVQNHPVNSSVGTATTSVCYNGMYEQVLTSTSCANQWIASNPVYMITALAVTKDGGRKMLQGEVAMTPGGMFQYGLFATGTGCGAISLNGNISTDSYTTAGGGTYATTHTNTGGDVGSLGNVSVSGNSASIGGSVGSVDDIAADGACTPGNPHSSDAYTGAAGDIVSNPANQIKQIANPNLNTPNIPVGPTGGANVSTSQTLNPGNYGDITLSSATLTLKAGTYYINSLSTSGNATITTQGQVTIYIEGDGPSSSGSVLSLLGNGAINASGPASNLLIEYAGTNSVDIGGTPTPQLVVYAPNAPVTLHGGGNGAIYGAIVGNTISNSGNVNFHYDRNLQNQFPDATYYTLLGFRELYY